MVRQFCSTQVVRHTSFLVDFGRSTIKFQNLENLFNVRGSKMLKAMTARVSCLMTVARMNNDWEVSQLIDVVNELQISKKYLIIFKESLNTTLLRKKAIIFNVVIHHIESGEVFFGEQSLRYFLGQRLISTYGGNLIHPGFQYLENAWHILSREIR